MINMALMMIMITLFGAYFALKISKSYKFFTAPIFCVAYSALLTAGFHAVGKLSRNEDLYYLVSIAAVLFWFGRNNYIEQTKVAEDIFDFQEVK